MRSALQKPVIPVGNKIKTLKPGANPQREYRAKATPKHEQVKRFGVPLPKAQPYKKPVQGEVMPRQYPTVKTAGGPAVTTAMPSMVASASHQKLERMLDEALTKADSHKQALRYHAARHFWQKPSFLGRRTGLKLALLVSAAVALMLFVAWNKMPQLSLKVAGTQAHIKASMPSYAPDGYKLASPAAAEDGAILMKYTAAEQADQGYDISQETSNLTSSSLSQTLIPQGARVQTMQVGGNTIYIYGEKNDAAWVNNGVLYTIKDRANLSSDQIIKIVQGMN